MKLTVKVKVNQAVVQKLAKAAESAMEPFMETFSTMIQDAQVVPKGLGDLIDSEFIRKGDGGKWYIGWNTPYSRYLFYGFSWQSDYTKPLNFRTDNNANAQARWTDPFLFGPYKQDVITAFANHWKLEAGGIIK